MHNTLFINLLQHKYYLYLVFLFLPITLLHAQNTSDQLANQLHEVSKNHVSESVYVQTSKGIYETGEDLWFKGYVLNSQYLTPSIQSKTLYVQLLDSQTKKAVWEEKYEITNGFVDGHIYVQDTLQEDRYTLAAYIRYSFYNDKQPITSIRELQIVKNITDYHQSKNKDTLVKTETKETTIDFQVFPESGHLVSGITSSVAFKAVDSHGYPKTVSGTLYENNTPKITFKTAHAGMGRFNFTPDNTKRYHIILDSLATEKQYTLPVIKAKGYVLQLVDNTKEGLTFKVSKNTDLNKETLYLRVQVRGVVYSVAKAVITKERLIKIPLKGIPQGIAEVTLFDQELEPVAERLVYVNQDQKLNIKAVLDKGEYLTKDQVKLKLKVTDQNNNPIIAHLGLSVYDAFYNNPEDSKTIESHYHLSAQLKGRLYNPSYYFNPENTNRYQALDLLLLTQGWRAYQWAEANLKQESLKKYPVLNDTVTGKLNTKNKKDQALLSQQHVMAFTADKKNPEAFIEVDSLGNFTVYPKDMQQAKGHLYLKLLLNNPKNKISIAINDPSFVTINRLQQQKAFNYPKAPKMESKTNIDLKPFTLANGVNKLDEIIVTGKKKRVFRDKYMGRLDSIAKLDMNNDFICHHDHQALNCWQHQREPNSARPVEGKKYNVFFDKYGNQLGQDWINTGAYEFKVLEYRYPVLTEADLLKKFKIARIKGYYGKKEFYSPVYDTQDLIDDFPDYRNTLFWQPDIITNESGEATIEFSTSDINSKFIGVIEGVNGNGELGRQTFEFYVRKRE
ncbi:hypothetical protein [Hwangdonia sp.]|uniref:hypothetical protein n=1 Tax=Hwangdonia sp. TaxID=1883432 RepID=UPI003AB897E8